MTLQSFTAGPSDKGFDVVEQVLSFVDAARARLAARRRYLAVKAELLDYAPAQLAELGISDADIERVAEDAAQ
jgi:hypothetical protein